MIKIGTPLTLINSESKDLERFRCKVVEQEENLIYVDYPVNEMSGRTSLFPEGTMFQASFVGQDNSVYRFDTVIRGKTNLNIPTLMLYYPSESLIRIQRREYVRIETSIDISIHDPNKEFRAITTLTQDISGGGASLSIPKEHSMQPGMLIDVWMVLPMNAASNEYVHVTAKVIRINGSLNNNNNIASIKFITIKDKDRQSIIRYCFEKQLKVRGSYPHKV